MSGQCHNLCSKKPKQVRMYVESQACTRQTCPARMEPHHHEQPIYLCAPCARELGHAA